MHTPDLRLRAERLDDHAAVDDLVAAAFGNQGALVSRVVQELRVSGHLRAGIVAEGQDGSDDGARHGLLGHVALSRSWVDARRALVEVLVLSPLSVAPAAQRRGIGTALLGAALEEAHRIGVPAVFLEGSWDYYGRRGFSRASALGFTAPSVRIPDPAFQVALLPGHEAWMSGALVYCDPFWRLDAVGLRDPLLAEVERAAEAVAMEEGR